MSDDLLNAYRKEAVEDLRTITALRAENKQLRDELTRARVNALNDAAELAILKADLREARQQLQDLLMVTPERKP